MDIKKRRWMLGLFVCYLILVFILIFYKGWGGFTFLRDNYASFEIWKDSIFYSINLMPLQFLFHAGGYTVRTWITNVLGNIVLFVPMGILVPTLFPKVKSWSWGRFILSAILLIVIIELVQLLLMCGQCDIDDVILNVSGMCIGFVCTKWLSAKR